MAALIDLNDCPDAGPRAFAAKWAHLPADSAAFAELAGASRMLSDRRLMEAIKVVVLQADNIERVRFLAITALTGQPDPTLSYTVFRPGQAYGDNRVSLAFGMVTDGAGTYGAQPVGAAGRAEILQTFQQLKVSDPDSVVRRISAQILGLLKARRQ